MAGELSIDQVLAREAAAIHGESWQNERHDQPSTQGEQQKRVHLNADDRDGKEMSTDAVARRKALYLSLNKLNRSALCCSGGGIRSATFCLGVIQALAHHALPIRTSSSAKHEADATTKASAAVSDGPKPAALPAASELTPETSLLGRLAYLSTVSGGGYVGSWLSSWRARDDFATILRNLTGRPSGPDVEPPELSWLRAYSNYLTPRRGLGSADTWAAAAIVVRNLVLNWLIIIPVVCLVLLGLKIIASISVWIAHDIEDDGTMIAIAVLGLIFLIVAGAFTNDNRPALQSLSSRTGGHPGNATDKSFIRRDLVWAVLSAIAVTIFLTSRYFSAKLGQLGDLALVESLHLDRREEILALTASAGLLTYLISWLAGLRGRNGGGSDLIRWAASGLVYGTVVGLGAYLFSLLGPHANPGTSAAGNLISLLVAIILGVPWVLMAQLIAEIIFVGLASYEPNSDADREWLGRAAGWLMVCAIGWAVMAFLIFAGGYFVEKADTLARSLVVASGGITGVISGLVTAVLGKSANTKATDNAQGNTTSRLYDIALEVAGPLFSAVLIVALSVGLDQVLLGRSLVDL